MARPSKSAAVSSGKIGKDEKETRQTVETTVRGDAVRPEPPEDLTEDQKAIFNFIVDGLASGDILGKLDVFVLESTAVAIDRLRTINRMIDGDHMLLLHTATQNSRAKYQADLWRGCNELCLSPQARAKLGSLAAQKAKEQRDPLMDALKDDD